MQAAFFRRTLRAGVGWLGLATFAGCLAAACSASRTQAGGLELVIATDLSAPADFDDFRLEIQQQIDGGLWNDLWNRDYFVPQDTTLPTTFAIAAGPGADQEALIRVTAFQGSAPVVLREAQVQVPTNRLAEMRLVLARVCKGQVKIVGAASQAISSCPTGQSCQPDTGACGSSVVDPHTLPAYDVGTGEVSIAEAGANDSGPKPEASSSGDATCMSGACACPSGAPTPCSGSCVDIMSNANHCNGCSIVCSTAVLRAQPACISGSCTFTCDAGYSRCTGACVDEQTDNANCGGCGVACTSGTSCQLGACACPAGTMQCPGQCTNTKTDSRNCGTCGHDCLGTTCSAGICQPDAGGACVPTTATENCIDGLDDDCNGLVDCAESVCQAAGYTCTAAAPSGWSGPAVLWTGTSGTSAPACPAGYQPAVDAHAGPTGGSDTCTCTCVPSGAVCSASGTFHVDQVCANPTCATVTPDSSGACTAVVPTGICGSGGSYTMGSSLPTASGGTCTPNVTTTPGPAPSWTTSARVCSWIGKIDRPGGCTNPGEQCLLGPPAGFHANMCVYQGGDVSCPTAFPNKTLLYSGESDVRGCGSCGCSTTPAGGTCSGTVTLYAGTSGCTGTSATYTLGSSCQSYTALTPSYVQAHYVMTTPGACSLTAPSLPTGSVSGIGPTTVCCR